MKVTITFESDINEDGYDSKMTLYRGDVVDLYCMADMFAHAVRTEWPWADEVSIKSGGNNFRSAT